MANRYHGKRGVVYASTSGSAAAVAIASLNSWQIQFPRDQDDVTSFMDLNKSRVYGLGDVRGRISGFWDSADESLFTGADSTDGVKLYLYPTRDAITKYWYGPAFLQIDSLETDVARAVRFSATFDAAGDWGRK
jgi:hypothetical protein